jgi:ferredoxin--NADP+ reductase
MSAPKALIGNDKVEAIEIEKTRLVHGQAERTGEVERLAADLVVSCIGYRSSPIPGVPFDERAGRFANDAGRILPGLYCVGWARRGPSGTIGTNRPDGYATVEHIAEDIEAGVLGRATRPGGTGFDILAAERALDVVTFQDWKKIEEAEEKAAREGAPREKFVDIAAMIRARG